MPSEQPKRYRKIGLTNVTAINPDTGEVTELGDAEALMPQAHKRARREVKFAMIEIEHAMPRLRMSKAEWTMFWTIVRYVDKERGEARIKTGELARTLGLTMPYVSRMLSELRRRNILLRVEDGVWEVNPRLLSRKSVERWAKDMTSAPQVEWGQ